MAGTSICKSVDIIFSRVVNLPMDHPDLPNIEGIAKIPPILIGDDSSLIRTLEEDPLTNWKTKIDALQSGVGPSQVIDNTGITFILGGILTLRTPIFRPKLAF